MLSFRHFIAPITLLAVVVVAAGTPAVAAAVPAPKAEMCGDRPCIQVGSFNLYWLGSANRSGQGIRSDEDVDRLVELIVEELDLEAVVLQEVNTSTDASSNGVVEHSTTPYQRLKAGLEAAGYRILESDPASTQQVVIAWDEDEVARLQTGLLSVRTEFDFGDGCRSSGLRRAPAVELQSGELDFWLVGTHLKSRIGGACSDRVREQQAKDLADAINDSIGKKGVDVIIAGDFNAGAKDASLAPLRKRGKFRPLTGKAQRAPQSGKVSYLVDPFRSLIDHLLIRKKDSRRDWVRKSTMVFDPETAGEAYVDFVRDYSDHAPVWASFYTDRDR